MPAASLVHRELPQWPRAASRRENIGWMFLMLNILSGATYSAFAKSLTTVFSPLSLIFVSEVLTLFFLLFSFGVIPTIKEMLRLRRWMLLPLATIAVFSGTLAPLFWFTGLRLTSAVNAALFGNAEFVFILLFATIVLHEEWSKGRLLAMVAILAGIVTIALEGFTAGLRLHLGDAFIILAALSFSIGSITFRTYLRHSHPQVAMVTRALTAIMVFFLLSPFREHPFIVEVESFPWMLLPVLLGFGFISKFLNVFALYQSLERLPVSTVSLFGSLAVIVSVLFSHWYLGEPVFAYHLAGGALIIAGTVILEIVGLNHTPEHLKQRVHHRA